MKSNRLEAFSDGVLAIIITIMVLEMKAPEEANLEALIKLTPVFLSYLVSFVYVGTYWNNHHHLFQITENVTGKVLWANLHLLFWLSLIPFTTSWIGENHLSSIPVALYGFILLMSGVSYNILLLTLVKTHTSEQKIKIFTPNIKNLASTGFYIIGIIISFFQPIIAILCYVIVLIIWFIPDNKIEKSFKKPE